MKNLHSKGVNQKMEKKRPGPKPDVGHQARLGFPHRTKEQIRQALAGEKVNYGARSFVDFNPGLEIGALLPGPGKKSFDVFKSPVDCLIWWAGNREKHMQRVRSEYLEGERCPGDRPSIFWQLGFGLLGYLSEADEFFLLDSHSLWWGEAERDSALVYLMENSIPIPETKYKGCLVHPCGDPIRWPDLPAVRLGDEGKWQHVDCKATKKVREEYLKI